MTTEAAKAAKARYDAKTARYVSLKLNTNTDKDIIQWLDRQEGMQSAIKRLIREEIKRGGTKTMTYKIRPEYLDQWGEDATTDTIVTEDDLEMITRGWGKKPEDVLDQLIPQE